MIRTTLLADLRMSRGMCLSLNLLFSTLQQKLSGEELGNEKSRAWKRPFTMILFRYLPL